MSDTIVVIPCFNEAQRLGAGAFDRFARATHAVRLMLVNDGSRDATLQTLHELAARQPSRCTVVDLGANHGKAEAVRRGMLCALAEQPAFVGYWDADLATPLEAILDFRDVLVRRGEIDLVVGSRIPLLGHAIARRPVRRLLGRTFARVASTVLRLPLYDTQCGAKLFRNRPRTAAALAQPFTARWTFDVEILARLVRMHRDGGDRAPASSLYEFPLEQWRDVPGSKLKGRDFVTAIGEIARVWWRYLRPAAPVYAAPTLPFPQPDAPDADRATVPLRRAA